MPKNHKPPPISHNQLFTNSIPPPKVERRIDWSFSFKYFNQIDNFGLDRSSSRWFVSLLDRLRELSKIDIETLKNYNPTIKDGLRYHEIDWEALNIPIQRSEFTWVDQPYLDNDEEFPFFQFHISKALGRIIGFWNEDSVIFYIVLLDPFHNMQPSSYNLHKIRPNHPMSSQYIGLLHSIEALKEKTLKCSDCKFAAHLSTLPTNGISTNAVIFYLDNTYLKELIRRLEEDKLSLSSIIELGLLS